MKKSYVLGLVGALAIVLIASVTMINGWIDPKRPDAATPTPHTEPAKPADPTAVGNSPIR